MPRRSPSFCGTIDHAQAKRLYPVAERNLIASGRYHVCGPFLEWQTRLRRAAERYRVLLQVEETSAARDIPPPKFARRHFVDEVAFLVGVLAINGRAEDAKQVCQVALQALNDAEFRTTLDAALTGHFPASLTG